MIIRKVQEEDIPEISTWFESVSWDMPPEENIIPKEGFVAEQNGELLACAWLYLNGTSKAEIQWTCTNPNLDSKIQSEAITSVVAYIQNTICKIIHPRIGVVVTYTKNQKWVQRLENLGFRKKFPYYQCTWINRDEGT